MVDFIKLNSKDRIFIIKSAKTRHFKNYYEFSKFLGVSRDMIFKYSRGITYCPKKYFAN